jgi:hypothetical protein
VKIDTVIRLGERKTWVNKLRDPKKKPKNRIKVGEGQQNKLSSDLKVSGSRCRYQRSIAKFSGLHYPTDLRAKRAKQLITSIERS